MRTTCVILGGGRGTRLYPLTQRRAKPAVPLAGKYRLIDIPLSNCINSGLQDILVLTQFQSASLNDHIARTYQFDMFSNGRVEILAAEQTDSSTEDWYQGTADAVRKQLDRICLDDTDAVLILSGDHLYRMDYRQLIQTHLDQRADVTVSSIPVDRAGCDGFGILALGEEGLIKAFREKPDPDENLEALALPQHQAEGDKRFLASMGVYVFDAKVLRKLLTGTEALDFGKEILPGALQDYRVAAHCFKDYWEDIGTIGAFYEANLRLTRPDRPFKFYEPRSPIYTRPRFLPPSQFDSCHFHSCFLGEGCQIEDAHITDSVVGARSRIRKGARLERVVMMGADFYEDEDATSRNLEQGRIDVGVGEGSLIADAIVDKNARIGAGCVIRGSDKPNEHHPNWSRVDGLIVIPKNATIPAGSVIS